MGHRVFQVAKSLGIHSNDILRKLIAEELPPPAGRNPSDRPNEWTHLSQVSLGLAEMIRQWHASGELKVLPGGTDHAAPIKARSAYRKRSVAPAPADLAAPAGSSAAPSDELARQALDAVAQIEHEARQKKGAHVVGLRQSRRAILDQLNDIRRQIDQVDRAMAVISGAAAQTPAPAQGARRDLSDVRERMGLWLEARRGEKFHAGPLAREFPELQGTAVSYVLKPLVEAGRIQADASEGMKRPKYFAP